MNLDAHKVLRVLHNRVQLMFVERLFFFFLKYWHSGGTAHWGPSLNHCRQKSLPLSSQTQCHNSALSLPACPICLEAFTCARKRSPWWGSTISPQLHLTDEKQIWVFFSHLSDYNVLFQQLTEFTFHCFGFQIEWSQWSRRNQTGRAVDTTSSIKHRTGIK